MPQPLADSMSTIALIVITASALLYLPLQVFALATLRGRSRPFFP